MTVSIERIKTSNLSMFHPVEDTFLKQWFKNVLTGFETYGKVDLTRFENQAINYEFQQRDDYKNRIDFSGAGGVTLTTQKMIIEYKKSKGIFSGKDIVVVMKRHRFTSGKH